MSSLPARSKISAPAEAGTAGTASEGSPGAGLSLSVTAAALRLSPASPQLLRTREGGHTTDPERLPRSATVLERARRQPVTPTRSSSGHTDFRIMRGSAPVVSRSAWGVRRSEFIDPQFWHSLPLTPWVRSDRNRSHRDANRLASRHRAWTRLIQLDRATETTSGSRPPRTTSTDRHGGLVRREFVGWTK